ncbi:glycoside hydrolase family 43 protein [Lentzea nigeriaca]|uniref:glycoside hydrolase family 43 protein n=1 Tax=Lentzea nigeriaca TaxID=1128665 RepID=UPI001958C645|nr:glycoside hydrolase family 43 protein [Lentzea nigeriaca]MBM7858446.1 sucrose-6-phosphate hydrolase SacC (GH32 family) [Lentzea nigeriaca]
MQRTSSRVGAALVTALLMLTAHVLVAVDRASAADPFTGYLMAHFTGEHANGEQIYFTHSKDGLHWTELNNGAPVLLSTVGDRGVRDPAIVRSSAGDRYWIIATDLRMSGSGRSWSDASNNGSTSLVVWESTDLVNWSAPRLLDVAGGIPTAGDAWAPEAIHDPVSGDYVLYWATNATIDGVRKHRIHYVRTRDFRTITAPQVYIERSGTQHIIDTQIVESSRDVSGFRYYRASKDSQITIEGSNSILGSWTTVGNLSHLGLTAGQVEGPMWMRFNNRDEWALWLDNAGGDGYLPIASTDLSSTQNFRRLSDYSLGTARKRHGSVLNLTAAEESRVLAKWGTTTPANRLQSFNFPDRYVRHANFDVRIDANVSRIEDSQFRIMPGLADSSAVSFQSLNYPGYYLRHQNYDFVLAPYDGTARFQADATFRQVPGLASSSWSSFQSYNYPDRYIRHYAYQLRLDPITTATGRGDATFRVTG